MFNFVRYAVFTKVMFNKMTQYRLNYFYSLSHLVPMRSVYQRLENRRTYLIKILLRVCITKNYLFLFFLRYIKSDSGVLHNTTQVKCPEIGAEDLQQRHTE